MKKKLIFAFIIFLIISGCNKSVRGNPAAVAMQYLEALAKQDKALVVNLSCKEWEEQAAMEVDALLSVGSELVDVNCVEVDEDGEEIIIQCSGELKLTYQDEIRSIDLSRRLYSMRIEDGYWRVCSYK